MTWVNKSMAKPWEPAEEQAAREKVATAGLIFLRQELISAFTEIDRLRSIANCYCACHSDYSSRPSCEHCAGHTYFHIKTQLTQREAEIERLKAENKQLSDLHWTPVTDTDRLLAQRGEMLRRLLDAVRLLAHQHYPYCPCRQCNVVEIARKIEAQMGGKG